MTLKQLPPESHNPPYQLDNIKLPTLFPSHDSQLSILSIISIHHGSAVRTRIFLSIWCHWSSSRFCRGGGDWSRRVCTADLTLGSTALLQCQQLFRAEGFIMDLSSRFNQILQMGAGEKVSQLYEFAVVFVFNIDDTPFVGAG